MFQKNKTFNCGCKPLPTYKGVECLSGVFFYKLKRNASARGLPVEVTKEFLWKLFVSQQRKCALTGIPLTLRARGEVDASVDRIDSARGYVPGNVQWVHKDINRMKLDFTEERFLTLCRRVVEHHDRITPSKPMPARQARQKRQRPGRRSSRE